MRTLLAAWTDASITAYLAMGLGLLTMMAVANFTFSHMLPVLARPK